MGNRIFEFFSKYYFIKSKAYLQRHGLEAFLKKAYSTIKLSMPYKITSKPFGNQGDMSTSTSKSIWDNSAEQYQKGGFKVYWELLSEVEKYQMRKITGDENLHFFWHTLDYIKKNIGEKNLKGISLGCSEGDPGIEMRLVESGIFDKVTVMDIAQGLLEKQRTIASRRGLKGIEYINQDLNKVVLEKNTYDLIWAVGTIHHTEDLESLFEQINSALKHNGIFMMREYIGPNYLQFTDLQLSLVNKMLAILPEKYRRTHDGIVKKTMEKVDLIQLRALDPSEAIRSEDIITVIKEKLRIINLAYTGGTLLHPLLDGIASNFERGEDAEAILKLMIFFEESLIENKIITSDYVFCMAMKK